MLNGKIRLFLWMTVCFLRSDNPARIRNGPTQQFLTLALRACSSLSCLSGSWILKPLTAVISTQNSHPLAAWSYVPWTAGLCLRQRGCCGKEPLAFPINCSVPTCLNFGVDSSTIIQPSLFLVSTRALWSNRPWFWYRLEQYDPTVLDFGVDSSTTLGWDVDPDGHPFNRLQPPHWTVDFPGLSVRKSLKRVRREIR